MAFRTLDITVGSAQKLKKVVIWFKKMDVYAVVSISDSKKGSEQEFRTRADRDGDANPRWESRMQFKVGEAALQAKRLTLDFNLFCERSSGNKAVGELSIPVQELLCHPGAAAGEHHSVTYDVRRPGGKPKGGLLTFSCKFGQVTTPPRPPPPPAERNESGIISGLMKAAGSGMEVGMNMLNAAASGAKKMLEPGSGSEQKVGRGRGRPFGFGNLEHNGANEWPQFLKNNTKGLQFFNKNNQKFMDQLGLDRGQNRVMPPAQGGWGQHNAPARKMAPLKSKEHPYAAFGPTQTAQCTTTQTQSTTSHTRTSSLRPEDSTQTSSTARGDHTRSQADTFRSVSFGHKRDSVSSRTQHQPK